MEMITCFLAMPEFLQAQGLHIVSLYHTVAWSFHKFPRG